MLPSPQSLSLADPQALAATNLCSASMNLSPPDISYKWNYTIFVILGLVFSLSVCFQVLHFFLWLDNVPLKRYTAFVHLSVDVSIFLTIMNCAAVNMDLFPFAVPLGPYLPVELLGSMVISELF